MHEANYPALTQAISSSLAPFRRSQEATMAGFGAMSKAAMAPGELSEKHKELIALGISVSQRCAAASAFTSRPCAAWAPRRPSSKKRWPWPSTWAVGLR